VTAIEETERLLRDDPDAWEPIVKVIEVIQMQQKNDWVGKYFTPEQQRKMQELSDSSYTESARQKLATRGGAWTEEDQKQASAQWEWVFAELKRLAAAGADPAGPEAQEWAKVRTGLLDAFTQRDPEIEAGLNTFWKNVSQMPAAERPVALPKQSEAETAFMERALAVYQERA
jgi:hypothetical protein